MPNFNVYPATALADVEQLRQTLETAIRNPITLEVISDEVESVLLSIDMARQGQGSRYYAVAIASGDKALGVMGLQPPEEKMLPYASSGHTSEIINAYVSATERGSGVGSSLLRHLETEARNRGSTEVILNSGPRYMRSGWPFWRRMYGEPVAVATDYYGPRFDAMVWRKALVDEK